MTGSIVPRRPVTNLDRVDGLNSLIKNVTPVFEDLGDRIVDYPDFIASDQQRSPLGAATRSVARLNCRIWAASDKSNFRTRVNSRNSELCGPYLDAIGENPDPASTGPDFLGGQCEGIGYYVTVEYFTVNTDGSSSSTPSRINGAGGVAGFPGPIRGLRVDGVPGNLQLILVAANGDNFLASSSAPQGGFRDPRIIEIVPAGGAADNCGNPDPLIRPPATVVPVTPIPPSININLPGVGPVDLTVTLNPDGDPVICIPVLEVCATVNIGGSDGGDGAGGGAPPLDPEIGDPIPQPGGGGGNGGVGGEDTPFGPPPDGRIWVGAFVQVLGDMVPWGVVPGSAPENSALTRVVGNASLIIDNGLIARVRTRATQIRSEWSEHLVAYPGLTVNGIRVNINPALSYRTFPISVADPKALET